MMLCSGGEEDDVCSWEFSEVSQHELLGSTVKSNENLQAPPPPRPTRQVSESGLLGHTVM